MREKPIRILHVIGRMNYGGAEVMIMNLYRHIDREKVQFDFVENWSERADFDDEIENLGGKIFRCPHYNVKNHFEYKKWWNNFFVEHQNEYKIIHGHLGSTAAIYLKIANQNNAYTIAHSHNTNGKDLKSYIYRVFSYPTRFIADYFFACSVDAGRARFGEKIIHNAEKFHVLNNAIETNKYAYNAEKRKLMRNRYNIADKIVVGNIGRFVKQKNHVFIIDIFEKIYEKNNNSVLLLVGDGELRKKIEEKVKKRKLEKVVFFMGSQENVCDYLQAMDVFVLPSLFEGLGIVAVEAQCSGMPCVISDKVSRECIVTSNHVSICKLTEKADVWAEKILSLINSKRSDSTIEVKKNGYDIGTTAKWISDFYQEAWNR